MATKIKVVIADDVTATRQNIKKLLEFHPDLVVVGEAADAETAIEQAKKLQPDILLMDINMPGIDGITATNILSAEVPFSSIIIMSVQGEQEYLRRAMTAGAKDYLTKPFTGDELVGAIKQVYANDEKRKKVYSINEKKPVELGKIITVFSTKGGVGKTTIASNLAVALANKTGERVGLVDADLQFGDVSLFFNVLPRATIADLVKDIDSLDENLLESYLTAYNDKVMVLPAPLKPEQAETITGSHMTAILKTMRQTCKFVIVDTTPAFNEVMLATLDISDVVYVICALDLPTIKNVKLCLEIMQTLGYSREKVQLIMNRANSEGGMDISEAEASLRDSFAAVVPADGKTVTSAVNRGIPFVISHPDTAVSQSINNLASVFCLGRKQEEHENRRAAGSWKRLFG